MTYLIFPKVLKGKDAKDWKTEHKDRVRFLYKSEKIDGIFFRSTYGRYFYNKKI